MLRCAFSHPGIDCKGHGPSVWHVLLSSQMRQWRGSVDNPVASKMPIVALELAQAGPKIF